VLKAIIVDDEKLERDGINDNIPWTALNIEVLGVYTNGEEAFEAIKKNAPDILLSDIRMPIMNGLTLAQKVNESFPNVKIILISGYDDFNYAQTAIEANVFRYMLKPVEIQELLDVIKEVVEVCHQEKNQEIESALISKRLDESMPLLKHKFYNELLYGLCHDKEEAWARIDFLGVPLYKDGNYIVNVIMIDNYSDYSKSKDIEYYQLFSVYVLKKINELLDDTNYVCINIKDIMFAVISSYPCTEIKSESINYKFMEDLQMNLSRHFNLKTTIGISASTANIISIKTLFDEAWEAVKYKLDIGSNQIIRYDDVSELKKENKELDAIVDISISTLISNLKFGNKEYGSKQIDILFRTLDLYKVDEFYIRSTMIELINRLSKFLWSMDIQMEDIFGVKTNLVEKLLQFDITFDIRYWVKNIFENIISFIEENNNKKNKKTVEKIMEIVKLRYFENLTIADIASEVFLSAGYATCLFKKETGKSIMDYILKTRIDNAKIMLKTPGTKVYEVSSNVGYDNVTYFSRLFKKIVGINPSEYQERNSDFI